MHHEDATVPAASYRLVVIAASAGGLAALTELLSSLPGDFPVPLAIVQHLDPNRHSFLAKILGQRTRLRVKEAANGDSLQGGVVYLAPPDAHMEILGRLIRRNHTEPVHFVRPAADRLFETAASQYGRVIGVVLSGTGVDGSRGARAVKAGGGMVIAQDQASCEFFGMPQSAIETGAVDLVLPLAAIGPMLTELTRQSV